MEDLKFDIQRWLNRLDGDDSYSHMLVICDTYNYDHYPKFVKKDEDVLNVIEDYQNKEMQRVMEVYNLSMDIPTQIYADRTWNV